jgi:hypothetical protein
MIDVAHPRGAATAGGDAGSVAGLDVGGLFGGGMPTGPVLDGAFVGDAVIGQLPEHVVGAELPGLVAHLLGDLPGDVGDHRGEAGQLAGQLGPADQRG